MTDIDEPIIQCRLAKCLNVGVLQLKFEDDLLVVDFTTPLLFLVVLVHQQVFAELRVLAVEHAYVNLLIS